MSRPPASARLNAQTEPTARSAPVQRQSPFRSVGIVGAGRMGQSVAALHISHGIPVTITDASADVIKSAAADIANLVSQPFSHLAGPRADEPPIRVTDSSADFADCELVIEAVTENRRIKQQVLAALEASIKPATVIASNTSTIPIALLGARLGTAERFCGLHFCHPVHARRLVEVVASDRTNQDTLKLIIAHAEALDRLPITVRDTPAFAVNRMLWPYLDEGLELLLDGVGVEDIESAAVEFGMPAGPIECLDEFGADVVLRCGATLRRAFPQRAQSSHLLIQLYESGLWGKKSGRSLFDSTALADRRSLSPAMKCEVQARMRSGVHMTRSQISERLFLRMFVEATRLLDEGVVDEPHRIDLVLVHGLGLSRAEGGLLAWADAIGPREVLNRLNQLRPLGRRFEPTDSLLQRGNASRPQ